MCRCLESIRLENGVIHLLAYHEKRFLDTSQKLFGIKRKKSLLDYLGKQDLPNHGLFKVRIVYGKKVEDIQVVPYTILQHKRIALIPDEKITYHFKLENRQCLDKHKSSTWDDFILVQNGLLTDSWFGNVALFKDGKWYTPSKPLLHGVKRASLVDAGVLLEMDIPEQEVKNFTKIAIINAMRGLETAYYFQQNGSILTLS